MKSKILVCCVALCCAGAVVAEPVVQDGVAVQLEPVLSRAQVGPSFTPIDMHPDGLGADLYADITGRVIRAAGGSSSVFLDLTSHAATPFTTISAGGLLGLAVHPGYADPGSAGYRKFYTYSSDWKTTTQTSSNSNVSPGNQLTGLPDFWHPEMYQPAGRGGDPLTDWSNPNAPGGGNPDFDHFNVVREWTATADGSAVDGSTAPRVVLRMAHGYAGKGSHNGGGMRFGPDGYLYLSTGDGGGNSGQDHDGGINNSDDGHTDATGNAQDRTNVYGKVLRIDPTAAVKNSANGQYGIPADNPHVGGGSPASWLDEIYASGFRNPWKLSFDDSPGGDGALYLADVGQHHREEVNLVEPGGNYGWGYLEGRVRNVAEDSATGEADPSDLVDGTNGTPVRTPAGGFAAFEAEAQAPLLDYLTRRQFQSGELVGEGTAVTGGFVYRGDALPELYGMYVFGDYSSGGVSRPPPEGVAANAGRLFYFDPLLEGDYNDDGQVDAADYTVWRDAGPTDVLPNDRTAGQVDQTDYLRWVANYGGAPDGVIHAIDFDDTASQWGQLLGVHPGSDGEIYALLSNGNVLRLSAAAPAGSAAPAPDAALLLLAAAACWRRRRIT